MACEKARRDPAEVALLAVSKMHTAASVQALFEQGQSRFGENRLQEALRKQAEIPGAGIEWHFIGPVQSNKTRDIAGHFDWVQSVDRMKIISRLSDQRPAQRGDLNICVQVNVDDEPQKAGVPPGQLAELADRIRQARRLQLRGLMCIPRLSDDDERTAASFSYVRELFEQLRAAGHDLDTLSMGMSADLEIAIAQGSTMVRVGTDLFGPRPAGPKGAETTND